ncbi:hypothetical protein XFF6991_390157 [Xanthomonas phaseoli pv. phaseoli]|uniref:Uncharacterized protein n=1 Tax=Xanthomonas campestris pv. phaseoli TaxID=317013 RepID=A0A7Z7NIJ3_XANCH|nr:hypothetical protein XFF6991_390157 [Xanthomonas phaseoli pv. phaseoli]
MRRCWCSPAVAIKSWPWFGKGRTSAAFGLRAATLPIAHGPPLVETCSAMVALPDAPGAR